MVHDYSVRHMLFSVFHEAGWKYFLVLLYLYGHAQISGPSRRILLVKVDFRKDRVSIGTMNVEKPVVLAIFESDIIQLVLLVASAAEVHIET